MTLAAGAAWGEGGAPPAGSAGAKQASGAVVKLRSRKLYEVKVDRGEVKAEARAQKATKALEPLIEAKDDPAVRVVEDQGQAVVYAGDVPVLQLTEEDAQAAGDASVKTHAAAVAAKVRSELESERQRHHAAQGVFSVSLVVFSGLLLFLLVQKLDELTERVRERIQGQQGENLRFRVGGIDVLSPRVLLGTLHVSLSAGRVLARVALGYSWVMFALARFDATRALADRMSSALVAPISDLVKRLVSAAPLVVVVALAAFVLLVLLRFLGVLFQGYAEGTTQSQLVPPDLAGPGGTLAQLGVLVVALVAVLPLVTGNDQGAAGRLGVVALLALGLGVTPLVATAMAGALQIFGRRLRPGDRLRLGAQEGKILEVNLLETTLEPRPGQQVRVPHLLGLVQPTELQRTPGSEVTMVVAPEADLEATRALLLELAAAEGEASVHLDWIDRDGALFRVRVRAAIPPEELRLRMAVALQARKIPLGAARGGAH
ncbi:MAG: mechanosensitive ion channel family protein [Polyangiaceae bacterium]|nr:mechanosensitive ion channel family protein [Polyangiaceae bacterium]